MEKILTIVIPCKNEKDILVECLDYLRKQNGIDGVQIIIADDSSDDTLERVNHFNKSAKLNIKYVKGGLPAVARNNGAKIASTRYLLFLDADSYLLDGNLLGECLEASLNGGYDLLTCKFMTDKKFNWIYRVFDLIQWYSSITQPFALGGFMLFKSEAFQKLKGFCEDDKIAEDYHLSSKVKPSSFKIQNHFVFTSSRRFDQKGVWFMIRLVLKSWGNRNNEEFFKKDYNYWL